MNVLSLFDGMSCGMLAFKKAGFEIENYYASEIDKHAIRVSSSNFPEIQQMGDIQNWKNWNIEWSNIDFLIGGSPCQGFSFAGKQLNFEDPRSKLFFVFVDILNHINEEKHKLWKPEVKFLLENVKMKKEFLNIITDALGGVQPVFVNSNLLSAQSRPRLYWCNWSFAYPDDLGIKVQDILQPEQEISDKYIVGKGQLKRLKESTDVPKSFSAINPEKAITMTARQYANWKGNFIKTGHIVGRRINQCTTEDIRRLTPVECERLQTLPDNYTSVCSDAQRYKMIGDGWTVDVIAHILSHIPK